LWNLVKAMCQYKETASIQSRKKLQKEVIDRFLIPGAQELVQFPASIVSPALNDYAATNYEGSGGTALFDGLLDESTRRLEETVAPEFLAKCGRKPPPIQAPSSDGAKPDVLLSSSSPSSVTVNEPETKLGKSSNSTIRNLALRRQGSSRTQMEAAQSSSSGLSPPSGPKTTSSAPSLPKLEEVTSDNASDTSSPSSGKSLSGSTPLPDTSSVSSAETAVEAAPSIPATASIKIQLHFTAPAREVPYELPGDGTADDNFAALTKFAASQLNAGTVKISLKLGQLIIKARHLGFIQPSDVVDVVLNS